jgi:hypothetical protein
MFCERKPEAEVVEQINNSANKIAPNHILAKSPAL